jgi:biofilm PGA synthesis N-glycosyltransferase PgaC
MKLLEIMFEIWRDAVLLPFESVTNFLVSISSYVRVLPLGICLLWVGSALGTWLRRKRTRADRFPSYAVLIPFYKEIGGAIDTARSLENVYPSPAEILLLDDGSPDVPGPEEIQLPPRTRIIRFEPNAGKASALNKGLKQVSTDIVVCMDADTESLTRDWRVMLSEFVRDESLGALTGAIHPKKMKHLCQWFQALDYISVIGLVKRAESGWGCLMTVSGAWAAYRKKAVEAVGGWDEKTSAEDIDMSWRLQAKGWRLEYNSFWKSKVEMVPTWKGLLKQRIRWCSGLAGTLRSHWLSALSFGATNMPVACITLATTIWIFLTTIIVFAFLCYFFASFLNIYLAWLWPLLAPLANINNYWAIPMGFFLQFFVGSLINQTPLQRFLLLALLAPFYFVYFWIILFPAWVYGFPRGILHLDKGKWSRSIRESDIKANRT